LVLLRVFFSIAMLVAVVAQEAYAQADALQGRVRYLALCSTCHGVPPDHRATLGANNPDSVSSALASVSPMRFLGSLVTRQDINNIAAYLGDLNLNQNVLGVAKIGGGAGFVQSDPEGLACGAICVWNFVPNTNVVLRATPQNGSVFTGWSGGCSGTGECRVTTSIALTVSARFERSTVAPDFTDLWWGGVDENGWGLSITHRAATGLQQNVLYIYDDQGAPTWLLMPSGSWSENFTIYRGALYRPRGAPLDRYEANRYQLGTAVGELTLRFTASDRIEMQYSIDGRNGSKSLVRQSAGNSAASSPFAVSATPASRCRFCRDNRAPAPFRLGDLWWGGANEEGWLLALDEERANLFGLWFTFDRDGLPTWYVWPTGSWLAQRYTATLYRATSAPWVGVSYDASRLALNAAGTMTFDADELGGLQKRYQLTAAPFGGVTQTKVLQRRP
jgi:hypothetical protein